MHKKMKYLLLLPMTAIVSCGYSTSYLVEGDLYTSAIFSKNYYTHWDNELKTASRETPVDVTDKKTSIEVHYGYGSHKLNGIESIDPNFFEAAPDLEEYGDKYKMNEVDDLFNYGYQSKLFDGQMVCGGQNGRPEYAYQKGRVQIPESGFSARFSKESGELHYFAMQFKASTDNTVECYLTDNPAEEKKKQDDYDLMHESKIKLTVTLYTKNGTAIEGHPFETQVNLLGQVEEIGNLRYKTNNGHLYTFLAFDLEEYNLSRLVGVSVEFSIVEDELVTLNKNRGVDMTYALFLYELFFPYTSWN